MINTSEHANKLINEKSPYLLQHAYNPVDWYPWNEEAFTVAEKENKPIFLSIGYSTCHWCHVMERESFEDKEIAELLNHFFVSIKVDREERPDIDHLYMEFCQSLTGSGGWPLTIIMTPEKQPFYVGTYFPKHSKYGRPGLADLALQLGEGWQENEARLRQSALEITQAVQARHTGQPVNKSLSSLLNPGGDHADKEFRHWAEGVLSSAYQTLSQRFDSHWGGFGSAPKFPTPHTLGFLLRYGQAHPDSKAGHMVYFTLDNMARGGIYDQIGFGFARYSTDEKWLVPHFEKMLYDNALLAYVYLEAFQECRADKYAHTAREIFTYILRDMTADEGGFYSAEDADSEGEEGKFYVWTRDEILKILGDQTGGLFCAAYNISLAGNFEGKGQNIPHSTEQSLRQAANQYQHALPELRQLLDNARAKLFQAREQRIHPHKDDKILTAWNSLMIAALAKGYQILGDPIYLQAAQKAHTFITQQLITTNQRLLARYRDGEAAYLGYLDDYAFFIWGSLELYTASGQPHFLQLALALQTKQEELFADPAGGYFLTGNDAEALLFRPKESYDGALPAGNSVSVLNLLHLARLTGDSQLETRALKNIQAFAPTAAQYPAGYCAYLQALQLALHQTEELILSGPLNSPLVAQMRQVFSQDFRPFSSLLYQEGSLGELIPWIRDYPVEQDEVKAYLCRDFSCLQPVNNVSELENLLHPN